MMQDEPICPYTGLRSFSEDESLYFKGRDHQIARVISQLEEKKFLMLTGASGDGKSSLIFAGLIPEARAGFFKALYSNWKVATFRPERNPFKNLSRALAEALHIQDVTTVENELSHGFSSLTEIYKSTANFLDKSDSSFNDANEDVREAMDRDAGNLLIVVDQFEEFFTNPENFVGGVPSQDARLVMNILLDTVKISLRDDLPVYVVFTMRSDYIGQCAAFSGLPEFIGFSQFFVPRLQRRELQQVIEEPAVLSGNRISKRLVDRLIFDLESTEDHLPILQHVLKEMWKVADQGRQEIDLFHYAMVGGMPANELPSADQERFKTWKATLPQLQQDFLSAPGLSNVLDIHATRLYSEAADVYNREHAEKITEREAKVIIAITFACLTRIDENRAVRNRMTLQEITGIINLPGITTTVVDDVLKKFRDPGNTLVRPFSAENGQNVKLAPDAVLDITHEALIRNWKLLNRWAAKEYEYYNTFLDYRQQLQRWIDSEKSPNYLLPIGPLTYFAKWFEESRPNAWWIKRYDTDVAPDDVKLQRAKDTLQTSDQFLRQSKRRLIVTRTFIKYGAGRVAAVAAGLILFCVSAVALYQWWSNTNQQVLNRILKDGERIVSSPRGSLLVKSSFVVQGERLRPGYLTDVIQNTSSPSEKTRLAIVYAANIFHTGKYELPKAFFHGLSLADSLIRMQPAPDFIKVREVSKYLLCWNELLNIEQDYLFFYDDEHIRRRSEAHAKQLSSFVFGLLTRAEVPRGLDMTTLNISITHAINTKSFNSDSLSMLIRALSPFEGDTVATKKFTTMFRAGDKIQIITATMEHSGGYDMLAHLYASVGDTKKALQCIDTLIKYEPRYEGGRNNSLNITGTFFLYDHSDAALAFVKGVATKDHMTAPAYMQLLGLSAGLFSGDMSLRYEINADLNTNLVFLDSKVIEGLYSVFQKTIDEAYGKSNEHDYALCLMLKQYGSVLAKKNLDRRIAVDTMVVNTLFLKALTLFESLPDAFVRQEIPWIIIEPSVGFAAVSLPRYRIFMYPDYFNSYTVDFSTYRLQYYSDAFFKFAKSNNLFAKWYTSVEDYTMLSRWIGISFFLKGIVVPFSNANVHYMNYPPIDQSSLEAADSILAHSGFTKSIDEPWIALLKANDLLDQHKNKEALQQIDRLNLERVAYLKRSFNEKVSLDNLLAKTADKLAASNEIEMSNRFVYRNKGYSSRMVSFADLGVASFEAGDTKRARMFLDSARRAYGRTDGTATPFRNFWDLRNPLVSLVALLDGDQGRREAVTMIADMADRKVGGLSALSFTYAKLGRYSDAERVIPSLANNDDRLKLYATILHAELLAKPDKEWLTRDASYLALQHFTLYQSEVF